MGTAHKRRILVVIPDMQAQTSGVDVAVTEQQDGSKDRLGQDIQDSVKDGLAVGGDDIATLAETPGDRVEEPEEDGPHAGEKVGLANIGAEVVGVLPGGPDDGPGDGEEGKHTKGPVAPLSIDVSDRTDL